MDKNLSNIPITELIPQRPPFVMVDRLISCCITDAVTELTVSSDNIFCDNEILSQPGMLENMAQSCAARMGWLNKTRNEAVQIGMIGEIKNCKFVRQPKVGELVTTHVHIVEDIFNLTLATVTMKIGEEILASTTIKIATVDEVAEKSTKKSDCIKSDKEI